MFLGYTGTAGLLPLLYAAARCGRMSGSFQGNASAWANLIGYA